jgi:Fe2+ or Zn2+ uptake regulation protein
LHVSPAPDEILAHLHRLGHNRSDRRRAIVEAVCARSDSFAAQEIADELAPRGIGRATVYRTIATEEVRHRLDIGLGPFYSR